MNLNFSKICLPVVGEYAYFDSRIKTHNVNFIVVIENGETCGCHYSLNYKKEKEPYVTCHGIIKSITNNHHNLINNTTK